MAGGISTPRDSGLAKWATKLFEALGVLNKGSSETAATPSAGDAENTTSVSSNALNVTRVSGLASLVTVVGAAAMALFAVDKSGDNVRMAAYIAVGVIVAAALITAGIIVVADIRARSAVSAANIRTPASSHPSAKYIKVKTGDGPLTIDGTDDVVAIDAADANLRVTVPKAPKLPGRVLTFERIDQSNHHVSVADDDGFGPVQLDIGRPEVRIVATADGWKEFVEPSYP
jgi:hypothetical protein